MLLRKLPYIGCDACLVDCILKDGLSFPVVRAGAELSIVFRGDIVINGHGLIIFLLVVHFPGERPSLWQIRGLHWGCVPERRAFEIAPVIFGEWVIIPGMPGFIWRDEMQDLVVRYGVLSLSHVYLVVPVAIKNKQVILQCDIDCALIQVTDSMVWVFQVMQTFFGAFALPPSVQIK